MERGDAFTVADSTNVFTRDLASDLPRGLDSTQLYTLKLVSLCLASVSVTSAILAFYWFIRIRRSFRHDLIMLLIQSDMFKALWFMIFPIVDFTHGPIKSSSTFCQVSGFFLTVGIEASDIAVLLIAVHTALYIFRPQGTRGEYGLYPYRRVAVAVLFLVPHLLASLAFIHKPEGYTNVGAYCYLPINPRWPRMALSWIPRYIIFLTILGTYGYIYFYVMFLIRRFGRTHPRTTPIERPQGRPLIPPTPPIAYHGLIPASALEPGDRPSERERHSSVSTTRSLKLDTASKDWAPAAAPARQTTAQSGDTIDWKWSEFGGGTGTTGSNRDDIDGPPSPTTATAARRASIQEPVPLRTRASECPGESEPIADLTHDSTPSRKGWPRLGRHERGARPRAGSVASIFSVLRQGPPRPRGSYSSTSSYLLPHGGASLLDSPSNNMQKRREKIRRQLRLLFIYPLVYLVIWVVPFVSHVLRWDDPNDPGPFGMLVVSLASLCIQGAVNSWLFSTREKPWKYRRRIGPSGWGLGWGVDGGRGSVGRTREEMLVEGRVARRRRDAEIEERRRVGGEAHERKSNRHWWDVLDVDAGMDSSDEELLL